MDLQAEATDVLSRLIRFDTVNPPGEERACQEWLKAYLEDAGLECELLAAPEAPERPNLVARLRGEADGPVLGYLSHVDTVLADAADWQQDPWSGAVHDGAVWGRGAIDMKSQTAAEAVAVAHLARNGWRPARGEVKLISVVDEETGGRLGAQWLTEQRPDVARVDWLLNEGGGRGDAVRRPPPLRRLLRREGDVPLPRPGARPRRPRERPAARGQRAAQAPARARADRQRPRRVRRRREPARLPARDRRGPRRSRQRRSSGCAAVEPRLAAMAEPMLGATFAPTLISAGEKINVIPARAEFAVDCRLPPGLDADVAERRARELLDGTADGLELEFSDAVVGNGSPVDTPLMAAIAAWLGEADPDAECVPVVLPAFTDCRWFRAAFPDCVAYGFFPQRHQDLYASWPLMHSADERLDVRDLGFATAFFADLPRRLLT